MKPGRRAGTATAVILAGAALLAGLLSCNQAEEPPAVVPPPAGSEQEVSAADAAADAQVPGMSPTHILFGQSAAFTGPARELGRNMRLGIEAAFHEANGAGGVHGRRLELVSRDDAYEPEAAIANTFHLIEEDRVFALIGAVGTPTSRSATPVAAKAGVPYIAPFTGAEFLRDPRWANILNLRASYYQETEEMVARLTEDLGVTRIAVLYQDDSFGRAGYRGVRLALDRRSMQPVSIGLYPRNTTAVKTALLDLQRGDPEAVIMIGAYQPVAALITWARHVGMDPTFLTVSFVGSNALAEELGSAGEGVYVTQVVPFPTDDSLPVVGAYLRALAAYDPDAVPASCPSRDIWRAAWPSPGSPAAANRWRGNASWGACEAPAAVAALPLTPVGSVLPGDGGAVALTVAASLVGWFFFDRVASVQRRVNEGSVPEMVAAFGVAQSASNLVAAAPRLTTAATREQLAGVASRITAHEIRNPLNFVKNFSEASEELIDELKEVLEEGGEKLDEEQRSLLAEITGDLVDNLGRIRSHGDRANRIVHDMLMMGRHSAEVLKVEVNGLLEEYARLAYHSLRASDPEFQLDMQFDLDPQMGELEVIPQDLGRVFLNMVANACDATDEKRRGGGPGEQEGSPYEPTLWIASKRDEERAVIRIKDNADGMPPEIVEKIFTPFFTTKPAGKGTGLGLAMSADIVREHGGTIQVNSEPGRFTEMVIDLPLEPPAKLGVGEQEP